MAVYFLSLRHELICLVAFLWLLSWFALVFVIILLKLSVSRSVQHMAQNYLVFIPTGVIWILFNVWLYWYLLWDKLWWKISSIRSIKYRFMRRLTITKLSNKWAYLVSHKVLLFCHKFKLGILAFVFFFSNSRGLKL